METDKKHWLAELDKENRIAQLTKANEYTEKFGVSLSQEQAKALIEQRKEALTTEGRIEFGKGVLARLVYAFCDSDYIVQDHWADTLGRLMEIFYLYKNEMNDEITDDELIAFMREQYDDVCNGDLDYLEGTCLNIFAQAVRAGYCGYKESGGYGEYEDLDLMPRWSRGEFIAALNELCQ